VDITRANLDNMIQTIQTAGALTVVAGIMIPPNYGDDYTEAFYAMYPDLAAEYELPLIPFFMKNVALNSNFIQPDGIHPTVEAQALLLDNVWEILAPILAERAAAP